MLDIKILSIQYPERYVARRLVTLAYQELLADHPDLEIEIAEISDANQICKYTNVLILPTLVMNERVVCSGRFPTKEEIRAWMKEANKANVDSRLA